MISIRAIALGGLAIVVAACGAASTSSTGPTAPSAALTASAPASGAASRGGGPASGGPASGGPVTIAGCPTAVQAGAVPSDRLVDLAVETGLGVDRITFRFGAPSGNSASPTGELRPVAPPFSEAGSGAPVTIAGDRFVSIVFRGMTVADEAGNAVYTGPMDLKPVAPAIQELRLLDNFEGHLGWVAGIRGPGCVRVTRLTAPDRILVEVQQP
jgi:hypothetical protein